jgi:hypothetical protein
MPFDPVFALHQIQERLAALRMRPAWIAGAGEFSRSILSEAASGQNPLTYPISQKIERTLDACEVLQRRAGDIPVDWQNSTAVRKLIADYRKEQQTPPSELQKSDWDLLASVISSEDPSLVISNLGISPAEFIRRLEETSRRFDGLIDSIRSRNDDKKTLIKIVNDELEAKRHT